MSAERPLRVGIVGSGGAGENHIKCFQQQPDAVVIAVADTRPARLAELKEKYQLEQTYENYHDLIARDDIDIISIGTPNYLHAPVAVAALETGKHVLTEKPIARNVTEAMQMVEAAKKNERVLKVIFNQRRHTDVETVKAYIDEGKLGRIYHAKASWMRRKGIPGLGGWFTTKELSGGGPLIDLGVHVLDMAMFLMGEPEPVAVSGATYAELGPRGKGNWGPWETGLNAYDVEDLATAFIRFEDGSTLLLEASWAGYGRHGDDFGVELYGTEGGAHIDIRRYSRENSVTIFTDMGDVPAVIKPEVRGGGGHVAVIREFVDIVRSGEWAAHRGEDGLRRARILDGIYQSAETRREVVLA